MLASICILGVLCALWHCRPGGQMIVWPIFLWNLWYFHRSGFWSVINLHFLRVSCILVCYLCLLQVGVIDICNFWYDCGIFSFLKSLILLIVMEKGEIPGISNYRVTSKVKSYGDILMDPILNRHMIRKMGKHPRMENYWMIRNMRKQRTNGKSKICPNHVLDSGICWFPIYFHFRSYKTALAMWNIIRNKFIIKEILHGNFNLNMKYYN